MSVVSVFLGSGGLPFGLRWSAGVGSHFSGSCVCLSLAGEPILSVWSFLSVAAVARPLSAGGVTVSLSFLGRLNACGSSFVGLRSVGGAGCGVEAVLLLMSSLVDSGGSLWRAGADSALDAVSSVGIRLGVTECLSPYESACVSFSSGGRGEVFLTQFLSVLWRFLCAACWGRVGFDCAVAWCCSVVLLARLSAVVVGVSGGDVGVGSLGLLRHGGGLSLAWLVLL